MITFQREKQLDIMHEILHVISISAGILLLQDVTDLPNAYESLFCNGEGSQQTCTIEEIQESTERRNFRTDTLQDPVLNILFDFSVPIIELLKSVKNSPKI